METKERCAIGVARYSVPMTTSRSIMSNVEAILVKLDNLTRRAMKSASTGGEAIARRAMNAISAMWDTRMDQVLKTTPQEVQEKTVKMVLLVVTLPGVDAISSTTITTSRESQNAALQTLHRLSMCQVVFI